MAKFKLSVSTNPPKIDDLFNYIHKVNNCDADYIHCDVMDGKFVPNFSCSPALAKQIKKETTLPLDVHLMVHKPNKCYLRRFLRLKPFTLAIHYEAYMDKKVLIKALQFIYKKGARAGLVINPDTQVKDVEAILPYCQFVVVMSVYPGQSGQKLIPECLNKIKQLRAFYKKLGVNDILIEIDGGVNETNIDQVAALGYDMVVMGSYLYKHKDLNAAVQTIKNV